MGKVIDLTGQRFGRLTVVEFAGVRKRKAYWVCQCDCGATISANGTELRNGQTKSCGCYSRDSAAARLAVYQESIGCDGHTKSPLYGTWSSMRNRCNNPNNKSYPYYGGRGIRVCSEWDKNFHTFETWALASGWQKGLSIDRADVNGDYSPENCRWVTQQEQCNNKRSNIILEHNGKKQSLSMWAKDLGVNYDALRYRYDQGWSTEKILTTPLKKQCRAP